MSLWFHTSVAGKLLRRRKGQAFRMVAVAMIGAVWCIAGASWTLATWRDLDEQASRVEIDILVKEATSDRDARHLSREIFALPQVKESRLIREGEVWSEFSSEVQVDEDLRTVVTLPRIVRFSVAPSSATLAKIEALTASITNSYPDRVSQIVWSKQYVRSVEARRRDLILLGSAAGILSLVLFLISLAYTFRAEINATRGDLEVGAQLGAKSAWLVAPHLFVSGVSGLIGLGLAVGVIVLLLERATVRIPSLSHVRLEEIGMMAAVLVVAGILVSWWQSTSAARIAVKRRT